MFAAERPGEAEHGDYATNVALRLAGTRRRPPREIAAEIAEAAATLDAVERAEVAGPGFVNLFLRDEWFASALAEILAGSNAFGGGGADPPQRALPHDAYRSPKNLRIRADLRARTRKNGSENTA